jgi:predicted nucleic acid-binding protein
MEKAIFDTSVWISFSKGVENAQTQKLEYYLINSPKQIYITPTIIQEFLMGLKHETDFIKYQYQFQQLNSFKPDWEKTSIDAAKQYFDLKKRVLLSEKVQIA